MRIRTLFLVCMSVLALMTGGLGCWLLFGAVTQYRIANRVEQALRVDEMLLGVAEKLSLERPPSGDALFADAVAGDAARAKIAAARTALDDVLAAASRQLAASPSKWTASQLRVIAQVASDVPIWRQKLDAAIAQPKSARDPGILNFYLDSFKPLEAALDHALDLGDVAAAQQDGMMMDLVALARQAWQVRMLVAARSTPMLVAMTPGQPLTGAQIERIVAVQAMLGQTWGVIDTITVRLSDVPGLAATVASAHGAFERSNEIHTNAFGAGRQGGAYPLSARDYGNAALDGSIAAFAIRDAALASALRRTMVNRQDAAFVVAAAATVVLLSMLATFGVLLLLIRRIVVPVLALTEVIGRIALLDFEVTIPNRERMDEIGRMAAALDALRRGAMAGEQNKARIVHMARHDALTGLPNRVTLQERLEQAVALAVGGLKSAALCLDLDRFKAVNDTFGHPTGDRLLQDVAERLRGCVRGVDTVSRLGGDEFVVLLIGLDKPDAAAAAAQRIVRAINEPFDLDGHVVSVGCSIGIAVAPQNTTSAVALLKCADTALYRAKLEEKGSWRFFMPEMDVHLQERMALERELRDAIANEAFELAYQPQYNLASDRLCGFEALLRWRHPVRGIIGPATFIPIAEETGLIVPIGEWVLRQACLEAMHWPDDVKLAVNLSAVQFKNPTIVQTVRQVLATAKLPARRLELEITETVLLKNSVATLGMLREMHDLGIQIAMDDFGTGYSSLSYLRSFPFDSIKIDKSFVQDLSDHAEARAIIRAVVALGNSLGMTTTAEGVETVEQLAELRREGCTDVQGYLFSRPVPAMAARLLVADRVLADIAVH